MTFHITSRICSAGFFVLVLWTMCSSCSRPPQEEEATKLTPEQIEAAKAMDELRRTLLTTPPVELGFEPNGKFPELYGAMLEFQVDEFTATVYGLRDGSASVYTTGGFGILGGIGHDQTREAAIHFVEVAQRFRGRGTPVTTFPYPEEGTVHFTFLTYEGPTRFVASEEKILSKQDYIHVLYLAGQKVLKELRNAQEDGS